jgi:hypothetical protein
MGDRIAANIVAVSRYVSRASASSPTFLVLGLPARPTV